MNNAKSSVREAGMTEAHSNELPPEMPTRRAFRPLPILLVVGLVAGVLAWVSTQNAQTQDAVGKRLQTALESTIADDQTLFAGTVVHVRQSERSWSLAAGIGDTSTGAAVEPGSHFRAGGIVNTFVAVVVLQLFEERQLTLDDPMTALLPASVTARFGDSDRITVRMLLNHTSGIPEWITDEMVTELAANPTKVWLVDEFLDRAVQPYANGWWRGSVSSTRSCLNQATPTSRNRRCRATPI
jgi:D-alanyl-D-alanine carboxypeptidase